MTNRDACFTPISFSWNFRFHFSFFFFRLSSLFPSPYFPSSSEIAVSCSSKRDINVSIDQITLERLNSYEPI